MRYTFFQQKIRHELRWYELGVEEDIFSCHSCVFQGFDKSRGVSDHAIQYSHRFSSVPKWAVSQSLWNTATKTRLIYDGYRIAVSSDKCLQYSLLLKQPTRNT